MNYIKKNPLFFGTLSALLLAFVVAFAWNIFLYTSLSAEEISYKKALSQYKKVQSIDPSEESVEASEKNIEEIDAQLNSLVKELSPNSSDIIKSAPMKEGYVFREYLRGMINKLRKEAKAVDVGLNKEECFGYSSYYKNDAAPPPDAAVDELWKQSSVLLYILNKLYSSKIEDMPLQVDLVQREILPIETAKAEESESSVKTSKFKTRKTTALRRQEKVSDTFTMPNIVSAKVEGSIDTFAFKLTFRTKTDVLRNFLNSLKDFDLMLVVRSVEVSVGLPIAKPELTEEEQEALAEQDIQENLSEEELAIQELSNANQPIIQDSLSEFTIIIEYVELSKEEAPQAEMQDADLDEDE